MHKQETWSQTLSGWSSSKLSLDVLPCIDDRNSRKRQRTVVEPRVASQQDRSLLGGRIKIDEVVRRMTSKRVSERSMIHNGAKTELCYNFTRDAKSRSIDSSNLLSKQQQKNDQISVKELKQLMDFLQSEHKTMMKYESHRFYRKEQPKPEPIVLAQCTTQKSFFTNPQPYEALTKAIMRLEGITRSEKENSHIEPTKRSSNSQHMKPPMQKTNTIRISGLIDQLNRIDQQPKVMSNVNTGSVGNPHSFVEDELYYNSVLRQKKKEIGNLERNFRKRHQ